MPFDCRCTGSGYESRELSDVLELFAALREECPALRELLVPDRLWQRFQDAYLRPANGVAHVSLMLNAFEGGYLHALTGPIHEFLLDEDLFVPDETADRLMRFVDGKNIRAAGTKPSWY